MSGCQQVSPSNMGHSAEQRVVRVEPLKTIVQRLYDSSAEPEMHSVNKVIPINVLKRITQGQVVGNIIDLKCLGSPTWLTSLGKTGLGVKIQEKLSNTNSNAQKVNIAPTFHQSKDIGTTVEHVNTECRSLGKEPVMSSALTVDTENYRQEPGNEPQDELQTLLEPQRKLIKKFNFQKKPQNKSITQQKHVKTLLASETEPRMKWGARAQHVSGKVMMKLINYQVIAKTKKRVMAASHRKSEICLQPQESQVNLSLEGKLKSKSAACHKANSTSEMMQLKDKLDTVMEQALPAVASQNPRVSKLTQSSMSGEHEKTYSSSDIDKYFTCPLCPEIFPNNAVLQEHIRKGHVPEDRFECDLCGKVYKVRHRLNTHRQTHKPERPFKCETCEKAFKLRGQLNEHTKIHTGEKRHFCDSCDFATRNKPLLLYHKNRFHNLGLDYMCEQCGKKFPSPQELKNHLDSHNERIFKCDQCEKSFHTVTKLISHKKIHNPNRTKFECTLCGASYAHMTSLRLHIRNHSGVTKHTCEFCGKNVSSFGTLITHRRTHTGEKPFSCDVCDKPFVSKKLLATHKRVHTGEKPFKCSECGKAFSQRGTLTIHLRLHSGIKPYPCKMCPKAFVTKTILTSHTKSAHALNLS